MSGKKPPASGDEGRIPPQRSKHERIRHFAQTNELVVREELLNMEIKSLCSDRPVDWDSLYLAFLLHGRWLERQQ